MVFSFSSKRNFIVALKNAISIIMKNLNELVFDGLVKSFKNNLKGTMHFQTYRNLDYKKSKNKKINYIKDIQR